MFRSGIHGGGVTRDHTIAFFFSHNYKICDVTIRDDLLEIITQIACVAYTRRT